jgi:hypothetical protein
MTAFRSTRGELQGQLRPRPGQHLHPDAKPTPGQTVAHPTQRRK